MKKILFFALLINFSCNHTEKIGDYNYTNAFKKVNSDGIMYTYKLYINPKNDTVFSTLVKGQKFEFQSDTDTIFASGDLQVKKIDNDYYITTKQYYINGYEKSTTIDSIIRTYKQLREGKVRFCKIVYYEKGKEKKFNFDYTHKPSDTNLKNPPPPAKQF
ncbi:hypothetical protein SAMN05192550_3308 [Flavobacterium glycines]|uniref:Uncharacterized protein n=1 Tax=Flavobacterium glycines TaxID=551990 RepID=A0A1B9DTU7_9FLAO|nr:hypothetical protein [Flavobacterium glycines]OCB73096.1 hypothetical protein FBGL_03390 [Flavobacterium glycines]GEL12366.1 hypothetical protein FGL01_31050 [Flavobacterium glycines]SDK08522.1 hypothetical protein SAMN05192550_3308 [Flavobacterium glycines]